MNMTRQKTLVTMRVIARLFKFVYREVQSVTVFYNVCVYYTLCKSYIL